MGEEIADVDDTPFVLDAGDEPVFVASDVNDRDGISAADCYAIGGGKIFTDFLQTGPCGFAGEVGHTVLKRDGPLCSCGRRGCAEALIATSAMLRGGGAAPSSLSQVRAQLMDADPETLKAVTSAGSYLGVLLQNLATAYDPGSIVLGGAVVELGEPFLKPALATLNDYAAAANLPPPSVRTCGVLLIRPPERPAT